MSAIPRNFSRYISSIEADSAASRSDEWISDAWEALCPRGLRWARPRTSVDQKWGILADGIVCHCSGKMIINDMCVYICIIICVYIYICNIYVYYIYIYISMMVSHGDFGIPCFQTKPDWNTVISWSACLRTSGASLSHDRSWKAGRKLWPQRGI